MSRARDEALIHYSVDPERVICAWCHTDTPPFELDHRDGFGNIHRRAMTGKLEYVLQREGWPAGYQVLCRSRCHALKSGRNWRMPPKRGSTDVHIVFPDALVQKLHHLVASTGKTRAQLMEEAFVQFLEAGADQTLVSGLHQRLDTLTAALDRLALAVKHTDDRQATLQRQVKELYDAMATLLDHQKVATNGKGSGFWRR